MLVGILILEGEPDRWLWVADSEGKYTVKSAYSVLQGEIPTDADFNYNNIWTTFATTSSNTFTWRALLDRIPCKLNLMHKNVINRIEEVTCPLCNEVEESTSHILFCCSKTWLVWACCYRWLGISTALPSEVMAHFSQHSGILSNKNQKQGLMTIWTAMAWSIWTCRNIVVFDGQGWDYERVFELAQLKSWNWIQAKSKEFTCSFYE